MARGLCREPVTATYGALAASGVPVLFVGAPANDALGFDPVARLRERVPQTEVAEVSFAGHELLREAPDPVAAALVRWLRDLGTLS
jgi:pimeloyl-ACP methyl ester carboxylesterase